METSLAKRHHVASLICDYFGITDFKALHEKNRNGNYIWAVKFICLFDKTLLKLSFSEIGVDIMRDRTTARHHLIKLCKFIVIEDIVALDYYNELLILFKSYEYNTHLVRNFVDNFNEDDYKRPTYLDRVKRKSRQKFTYS